ncbi:MAG TPA: hypothetical protein VGP44_05280 [Gemmatimonadales bacterium]|nr:hypothetical protein [Gemmatimonadales bacterium]
MKIFKLNSPQQPIVATVSEDWLNAAVAAEEAFLSWRTPARRRGPTWLRDAQQFTDSGPP